MGRGDGVLDVNVSHGLRLDGRLQKLKYWRKLGGWVGTLSLFDSSLAYKNMA